MSSTDFFVGLGNLFTETFKILPIAGDAVNWLFIIIITAILAIWMGMQQKYNSKEMKESGKLK